MASKARSTGNKLDIVVVARDSCRYAKLREAMQAAGLHGTIRRLAPTRKTYSYLARTRPARSSPPPDLAFFDLADPRPEALDIARKMVCDKYRSRVPLVILTSPESESLIASGELDEGRTTMFSARPLESFIAKLAPRGRNGFLRALATLYQYGPLLARLPLRMLENCDENDRLSA